MAFKKIVSLCIAFCFMAALAVAMSGCDDLGVYENTDEYYSAFGDDDGKIFLIDSEGINGYSVKDDFYNEESRENFLTDENGVYHGAVHSDYLYLAIPFRADIDMDSLALFMHSESDVSVYVNVFAVESTVWDAIVENLTKVPEEGEPDGGTGENTEEETVHPAYDERIGEAAIHLKNGKWSSFVLDSFYVNGEVQKSIEINNGQYILLQIINNVGVNEESGIYVDSGAGLELQKAELTMTNLLIRALDIKN